MEENNTSKEINLLELIGLFFDWLKKLGIYVITFLSYFKVLYLHIQLKIILKEFIKFYKKKFTKF